MSSLSHSTASCLVWALGVAVQTGFVVPGNEELTIIFNVCGIKDQRGNNFCAAMIRTGPLFAVAIKLVGV